MDVEVSLLTKAISTGEVPELISRGIEPEHFADEECQDIYEFCGHFMRNHGMPPSIKAVKTEFPKFKSQLSPDPLSYHIEKFVLKVKERMAIELVRDYSRAIDDPDELSDIEVHAFDMARRLSEVVPAPRALRFSEGERRKQEYEDRAKQGNIAGILMGIPSFDTELFGIKPSQLLTIAGYMGMGKSVLMAYIAYSAYLQKKTSLIISLEMGADEIMERIDVLASNVKFRALKALELDIGDKKKWHEILEQAAKDKHERDIIVRDDIFNCTANHVFAEASRWKPDIVFVDYLELMSVPRVKGLDTQDWKHVSAAGQGLKQNARVLRIPHVTATQINREGGAGKVTLSTVAHQSIGKHSDVLFGLTQTEEQEAQNEMRLVGLKVRGGKRGIEAILRWNLDRMDISEKGVAERFPKRLDQKSIIGPERRRQQQLEIAETLRGLDNPWKAKNDDSDREVNWSSGAAYSARRPRTDMETLRHDKKLRKVQRQRRP